MLWKNRLYLIGKIYCKIDNSIFEISMNEKWASCYSIILNNLIKELEGIFVSSDKNNLLSNRIMKRVNYRKRVKEYTEDKIHKNGDIRVIIITMGLSRIVKPIVYRYNVVGIIECAPRNIYQNNKNIVYKVVKYCYSFIKRGCETLISFSFQNNIPYYYMDSGSDKNLEKWTKERDPDIIVVFSMSQLLRENIFSIPKYGTINLHHAYLPKYRGPQSDFWMYYYQEKEGGVTVHFIDNGEDTGDIIYQEKYNIPLGMRSPDMMDVAIGNIGVRLLLKALDNIKNLPRTKQPEKSLTQRARIIKIDEHDNIIKWNEWSIERIWHILRGTELWLNAFAQPRGVFSGHRYIIENFEKMDMKNYKPSKIYKEGNRRFVACRDGKIFLNLRFDIKIFISNIFKRLLGDNQ